MGSIHKIGKSKEKSIENALNVETYKLLPHKTKKLERNKITI